MGLGTLGIILSNFILFSYAQYYADNQYYYYNQQYQQQYWPQRAVAVNNYPQQTVQNPRYPQQNYRQPPQAIIPPLQQQQAQRPQYVPEKKTANQAERVVASTYDQFDLPPPPPSRFLPNEEKTKILSINKQGRPEHNGIAAGPPQQRIRLVTGATNTSIKNQSPPQVQIHHLQVPRLIQKPQPSAPSQITHFIVSTTTQALPQFTSTFQQFTVTQTTRPPTLATLPTTTQFTTERHFETEATTLTPRPTSHLSTARVGSKKINPNKIFLQCCHDKKLPITCHRKCDFDNINKKTITAMFLGTDPCPQAYGLDLFSCAAQEHDHTTCCQSKNVQRTSAGAKCLAFCNLTPESHFQADASYLPCWAILNDVRNCFKEAILNGGPM